VFDFGKPVTKNFRRVAGIEYRHIVVFAHSQPPLFSPAGLRAGTPIVSRKFHFGTEKIFLSNYTDHGNAGISGSPARKRNLRVSAMRNRELCRNSSARHLRAYLSQGLAQSSVEISRGLS
jgi:hypothetical protein